MSNMGQEQRAKQLTRQQISEKVALGLVKPTQSKQLMLSPLILAHLISNLASIFILRTVVRRFRPTTSITAIVAAIGSQRRLERRLTLCHWFGSNASTFFRARWESNRKFSSFDSFSFCASFSCISDHCRTSSRAWRSATNSASGNLAKLLLT